MPDVGELIRQTPDRVRLRSSLEKNAPGSPADRRRRHDDVLSAPSYHLNRQHFTGTRCSVPSCTTAPRAPGGDSSVAQASKQTPSFCVLIVSCSGPRCSAQTPVVIRISRIQRVGRSSTTPYWSALSRSRFEFYNIAAPSPFQTNSLNKPSPNASASSGST